jgi:hypothetical protein
MSTQLPTRSFEVRQQAKGDGALELAGASNSEDDDDGSDMVLAMTMAPGSPVVNAHTSEKHDNDGMTK